MSQANEEIARLQGALKAETESRAADQEKLKSLKLSVNNLTQENTELKTEMQDHEENFKEQHNTLQKQLNDVTSELARLKKMITAMIASLVGKCKTSQTR